MSGWIHDTTALCPACETVCSARLEERAGDVWMSGRCPDHGNFAACYFRDAALYRGLYALRRGEPCCRRFTCAQGAPCARRATDTLIYMVNVTNNCNMSCASCLAGARDVGHEPYLSVEQILSALPKVYRRGRAPHAVLFGGEPTLHPQLPALIRQTAALGYVVRLATNGLKLRDAGYAEHLAKAGLRWLFLHVDSLDDERNRRLRGRPMRQVCEEVVTIARRVGMKVQLGITVNQSNLEELDALLHYARSRGVFWVSLYPAAEISRVGTDAPLHLSDVVNALESQTVGRVARRDFLEAAGIWSWLFRHTGTLNFRQKPTMVTLPLVATHDGWTPVPRLLGLDSLRRPAALLRFARALPRLVDYERRRPDPSMLVVNIQQFQSRSAFDLEEASLSHMSYAEGGSFLPFDVYNHCHRGTVRSSDPRFG